MNTDMVINFQKAAVDALQSMTKVLKEESTAGKDYEALLDGAKSLAAGLGGMLKVSSYGARVYETSDTHRLDSANVYRKRRSFPPLDPAVQPRSNRDAAAGLLQAKNEVQQYDAYHGLHHIFRSKSHSVKKKNGRVVDQIRGVQGVKLSCIMY